MKTELERFDAKWEAVTETGCWLWTACPAAKGRGYGSFSSRLAHRASWELRVGPIPDGLCVLHHCDTPACVNPAHLFLGTNAENTADKMAKGRHRCPRGEAHVRSKVTEDTVRAIRAETGAQRTIARKYGIAQVTVWNIRQNRTWAHVA
jgi:hypothetical protein